MRRMPFLLVVPLLLAAASVAAEDYTIDFEGSDIHWLVYKAGAFARLGHNHVISAKDFSGRVTVNRADMSKSRFELTIPVASLVVDDPTLRGSLGEDFASVPSADDVAGTRKNMLGEHVLQGEQYPVLRVTGVGPIGEGTHQTLQITAELLGRSVDLTVPVTIVRDVGGLEVVGVFELSHADLGMKPFSVMAGALQVADHMTFSYRIRARGVSNLIAH